TSAEAGSPSPRTNVPGRSVPFFASYTVRRFCPADNPAANWANTSRRPRNRSVIAKARRALCRCSGCSASLFKMCGGRIQQTWGVDFIESPFQNLGERCSWSYCELVGDSGSTRWTHVPLPERQSLFLYLGKLATLLPNSG